MAEFVDFNLTFTDNSSGAKDEDGTEVQIHTDSPSFVPNIPVDHAYGGHPWMALPLVGPSITTIPIKLETPLSFVRVRVRQFNENGNGPWNSPGGGAGELFNFVLTSTANAPDAPSNVGLVVTGTPTPPVDPPDNPPPDPEPPDTGTSTNFAWPTQFSGTQGSSGWRYEDDGSAALTYDAAGAVWRHASSAYLTIWAGGLHPGPSTGARLEWTAPATATVTVTGNWNLYSTPGSGNGVTMTVRKNASVLYSQSSTNTTVYNFASDSDLANIAMNSGDTLSFTLTSNQVNNSNESTQLSINISSTDGGTPTNPIIANVTPSSVTANTGTTSSHTVNLSNVALSNATVSLSSTNGSIASVSASIVIPTGQSSGSFSITAAGAGSATVTASYNSSSAQVACTYSTPSPGSGNFANEPSGMTQMTNTAFSDSLPSEFYNVYNTAAYASPGIGGTTFSPPRAFDVNMPGTSTQGNGLWGINHSIYREIYSCTFWGTNSGFQGLYNQTNKLYFHRGTQPAAGDNSFLVWQGAQDSPRVLKWYQQGIVNNTHIPTVFNTNYPVDGTGWFEPNVNSSVATVAAGSGFRKIEIYLKASTTATSRDGIIRIWIDGTLSSQYTNANLSPTGFNEYVITPTWDGGALFAPPYRDSSRSWHHYYDHVYISYRV